MGIAQIWDVSLNDFRALKTTDLTGGGGGSASLADVVLQDAAGVLVLQRDNGTTRTYLRLDTGAAYTPTQPLTFPTTGVTGSFLTDAQLRASSVAVSGASAVGTPPSSAPLAVSGVDAAGNKQHLRTDTAGNQGVYGAATRSTTTATIANGASVSGSVDLASTALLGFIAPAGWTTAALNVEVSMDNSNWATAVYDGSGSAVSSWSSLVAGAGYAVDTVSMLPFRYVRFRSGTSASPVTQGAQRDFTVITRPLA